MDSYDSEQRRIFLHFFFKRADKGSRRKEKSEKGKDKHANWLSSLKHSEVLYAVAGIPSLSLGRLLGWLEEGCEAASRREAAARGGVRGAPGRLSPPHAASRHRLRRVSWHHEH